MMALDALIDLYSFTDISTQSGAPYFINVNLRQRWNQIHTRVQNNDYTNDYAFQTDLMNMFNPLNDAHTIYRAPLGYLCFLIRPFELDAQLNAAGNGIDYTLRMGPLGDFTNVAWQFVSQFSPQAFYDQRVDRIDGQSVTNHLLNFSNQFISSYKDNQVRYNAALRGRWSQVLLNMFPVTSMSNQHVYTMTDGRQFTADNLVFCENGIVSTQGLLERNKLTPLKRLRKWIQTERQQILARDAVQNMYDAHRMAKPSLVEQLIEQHSKRDKRALFQDTSLQYKSLERFGFDVHQEYDQFFNHLKKQVLDGSHQYKDKLTYNQLMDLSTIHDWTMHASHTPSSLVDSSYKTGSGNLSPAGTLNIIRHTSNFDTVYMQYVRSGRPPIYVFRLRSFSPNRVEDTIDILRHVIQNAQSNQIKSLIVDVSNNGGGLICLANLFTSMLAQDYRGALLPPQPGLPNPLGIYDYRQSITEKALRDNPSTNNIFTSSRFYLQLQTQSPFNGSAFHVPITRTRGGFTSNYTQQAYFPSTCIGFPSTNFQPVQYFFENILIVSDGTCGSACTLFLSKLQTNGYARVVNFGGPVPLSVPMSTSSFAGGNVLEYNTVSLFAELAGGGVNMPPMITSTANTRFNFNEYYEDDNLNVPREFIKKPADFHLRYWLPLYNDRIQTPQGLNNMAVLYDLVVNVTQTV